MLRSSKKWVPVLLVLGLSRDSFSRDVIIPVGEKLTLRCPSDFNAETHWYKEGALIHQISPKIRVIKQILKFKYVEPGDSGNYACSLNTEHSVEWWNVTICVKDVQTIGDTKSGDLDSMLGALRPDEETNEVEVGSPNLPEMLSLHLDPDLRRDKAESGYVGGHNETTSESPPMFKKISDMHSVIAKPAGNILRLRCLSIGNPHPNITWLKNNAEPKRAVGPITMTKWTLMVEDLEVKDSGNYTCIVCNYLACINHTFKVDVIERFPHKPYINEGFPRNVTAVVNRTATFRCPIVADLEPYIQWVRLVDYPDNEEDLPNGTLIQNGVGENPEILMLYNVTKEDEGWYTCIAQNVLGQTFSSAYLAVVENFMAPFISETNMNKTAITVDLTTDGHKSVVLKCHVRGRPKPNITWYKDDTRISANEQYEYGHDNQELDIKYFHEENSGTYTCKVENNFGKAENYQIILIKVKEGFKVLIISIVALVLICVIFVIYFSINKHREKAMRKRLMEAALRYFEEGAIQCLNPNLTVEGQAELLPYDKRWEFPRERLKLGRELGSGAFGVVTMAYALGICKDEAVSIVAVKMVRKSTACTYIRALASELKIMVHLGKHLNVVNFLGACTKNIIKHELLVIVEYCRFGNMHDYLLRHRTDFINQVDPATRKLDPSIGLDALTRSTSVGSNSLSANSSNSSRGAELVSYMAGTDSQDISISQDDCVLSDNSTQQGWPSTCRGDHKNQNLKPICTQDLLSWAFQVARGMEYLSQRKVLHGDLAARNILLAEHNIVKISDFGLARTMYKDDNYKKQGGVPLPIKWMAIESIRDRIFSTQSDIWSFGIVLWELFTLAETPYPTMGPERQYQRLIEGYRMEQPEYATDEVYNIMLQCWEAKPTLRPTFTYLVASVGALLEECVKDYYMDLNIPYMSMNTTDFESGKNDYLTMMSAPDHDALVSPNNDNTNLQSLSLAIPQDDSYRSVHPSNHGQDLGIVRG